MFFFFEEFVVQVVSRKYLRSQRRWQLLVLAGAVNGEVAAVPVASLYSRSQRGHGRAQHRPGAPKRAPRRRHLLRDRYRDGRGGSWQAAGPGLTNTGAGASRDAPAMQRTALGAPRDDVSCVARGQES